MARLTEQDFIEAARFLDCEVSDVMSVAEVEARGAGFLADGRPVILFERHIFSKQTKGRFDQSHPHLSNRKRGGYRGNEAEWLRFHEAAKLDRRAAMMSISMGLFQLMGFNYKLCGYPSVEYFFSAMHESEAEQLRAFCYFVKNSDLDDEMREGRYADFARGYNGSAYQENHYDTKLRDADRRYEAQGVDNRQPEQHLTAAAEPIAEEPLPAAANSFSFDGIRSQVDSLHGQAETVTNTVSGVRSVAGRARASLTAVRKMFSMKELGGCLSTVGAFFSNHWIGVTLIIVGLLIVIFFAYLYKRRQDAAPVNQP